MIAREKLAVMRQIAPVEFGIRQFEKEGEEAYISWGVEFVDGNGGLTSMTFGGPHQDLITMVEDAWKKMMESKAVLVIDDDHERHYYAFYEKEMRWIDGTPDYVLEARERRVKKREVAEKRRKRSGKPKSAGT
ncbi:hypothetical protein A2215_00250 [Candidatus Berkelbacteria bacterium RIFOXYA2_FULL_43_10]|uniref:Uncharacterized protein n=1 Tax=Candidatus Berkelbacteria bacterium RIFOXYA2_FULL_43_10 TaxID=1797472 RepID=A0A1F5EDJ0_9BACT|nr:MAG: hypothetical protein A2215_00250 [Candidatus Berkelbacteria bacterium RIFOXYA2_FULL_43_10]